MSYGSSVTNVNNLNGWVQIYLKSELKISCREGGDEKDDKKMLWQYDCLVDWGGWWVYYYKDIFIDISDVTKHIHYSDLLDTHYTTNRNPQIFK